MAARKGDRTALALALDEMRTLAYTPRYWTKYLTLLEYPLARLVDLLIIKQGEKIARQKGWTGRPRPRRRPMTHRAPEPRRRRRRRLAPDQPSLFPSL